MKKIVQFLSIFVLGFISAVAVQETVGLIKLKNKILKSTEKLVGKKIRGIASAKNGDTEKIEDEKTPTFYTQFVL